VLTLYPSDQPVASLAKHVLVAGGIRGALALALALSLSRTFSHRNQILAMTFGVVAFTIIVQGRKSAIEQAVRDGLVSQQTGNKSDRVCRSGTGYPCRIWQGP